MGDDTVSDLIAKLSEPDLAGKVQAANTLGDMADPTAINALVTALDDRTAVVRQAALSALGQIGLNHTLPVETLIPLLADNDDDTRVLAAETLKKLDAVAVVALIDGLYHSNSTVRGAAADLLGVLKDERAQESLTEVSRTDSSRWVRSRAENALNQLLPETPTTSPGTGKLTPPPDTLKLVRSQAANLPSLDDDDEPDSTGSTTLSAEQIQTMLDNLDLRLANGEISEDTYHTLYARWQKRLDALKD